MKIFLVGFMGSGKSYLGRELAELLQIDFIDLDLNIELKAQKSITDIFSDEGEDHFRKLEQSCLQELFTRKDGIISTGGGTPCFFDNMEWMNKNGLTIFLNTSPELLVQRLINESDKRPLIKGMSRDKLSGFIKGKLEERLPFYQQALLTFDQNLQENPSAVKLFKKITDQLPFK